jgi:xanthine dehydrogenase accessory factor
MLRKDLGYLGMMSSKGKLATIHELLKEDGFTSEEIAKVDSPIGIPIKSKTPAEIAVSIAAKIIEVKNTSHA